MILDKQYVTSRIESLRVKMQENDIDIAFITNPVNVFHFSLFNPVVQSMPSFMIIPTEGEPCLLVHALRGGHAKMDGAVEKIRMYASWGNAVGIANDPFTALRILMDDYGIRHPKVGCELGFLSVMKLEALKSALGLDRVFDITNEINYEKLIKDELAVSRLKMAAHLSNVGMNTMVSVLRSGGSEIEVCNEAMGDILEAWKSKYSDYEMCGFGTSEEHITTSMCITCSSGSRISFGADAPKKYVPQVGDFTLPISITTLGGYSVENERSLHVGAMDDYKKRIFETVISARKEVLKRIEPGITFSQLFNAAAEVYEINGFADFLPGRIGHGIGLSLHEWPSVAKESTQKLETGMVFTVEPGIVSHEFGGVRPSDTVLVTQDGYLNLTDTENGLLEI